MPRGLIYGRTGIYDASIGAIEGGYITGGPVGTPDAAEWTQYQDLIGEALDTGAFGIDELAGLDWYAAGKIADIFGAPGSAVASQIVEGDVPLPPSPQQQLKQTITEAKMAWEDEWGFDSGTFGDIASGLQQVRQLYANFDQSGDSGGQDAGGGEMIPVMGSIGSGVGAAVATGGIWLGSLLARALGRGAASAVFTAANGVRVRIAQLWPLVRRYGAQNVAGALGITVGALGTMLMQPGAASGRGGFRKRRRGISARDVTTTRRTIKQLRNLTRMAGIGGGGGGGYRRRSYRRPRRAYYC